MAKWPQRSRAFQTRKQQGQRLDEAHGRTVSTAGAASVPARVVRKADQTYNNNEKDLPIWEYHSVWLLESYLKNNMKDEICPCYYLVTGMDFSRI